MDASAQPAHTLDARTVTVWRIQTLVWGVPMFVVGLAASVALWLIDPGVVAVLPLLAAAVWLAVALTVVPAVRYRRWRWEVTDEEIRLQRGLIIIQRTVVPMVRVQHVDTSQGPINGAFGLSEVRISTAAGTHSIPALADENAAELRDRIARLARVRDDGGL